MQIFVRVVFVGTITIVCSPHDTIAVAKALVQGETGVPRHQFRLVFAGDTLEDGRTLSDYNIQKESTLVLAINGRGGGKTVVKDSLDKKAAKLNALRIKALQPKHATSEVSAAVMAMCKDVEKTLLSSTQEMDDKGGVRAFQTMAERLSVAQLDESIKHIAEPTHNKLPLRIAQLSHIMMASDLKPVDANLDMLTSCKESLANVFSWGSHFA